jgi:hypothetical protein
MRLRLIVALAPAAPLAAGPAPADAGHGGTRGAAAWSSGRGRLDGPRRAGPTAARGGGDRHGGPDRPAAVAH